MKCYLNEFIQINEIINIIYKQKEVESGMIHPKIGCFDCELWIEIIKNYLNIQVQ